MATEFRVVIDTNLLVSGILLANSPPREVLDRIRSRDQILLSLDVFAELESVLMRAKFDRYVSREKRGELLELLPSIIAEWIAVSSTMTACRDPRDNKFLELAQDGGADFLVTGDDDLLVLAENPEPSWCFRIVRPKGFLSLAQGPG